GSGGAGRRRYRPRPGGSRRGGGAGSRRAGHAAPPHAAPAGRAETGSASPTIDSPLPRVPGRPHRGRMQTRNLGRTGPTVAALGLGAMGMAGAYGAGRRTESIATAHAAL